MKTIRSLNQWSMVALVSSLAFSALGRAQAPIPPYPPPAEVRAAFRKLLDRPTVPADARLVGRRTEASGRTIEDLTIATETKTDGTSERVPIRLVTPAGTPPARLPTIIVLHGTGGSRDSVK